MKNKGFYIGIGLAVLLVLLVRFCAFTLFAIPGDGEKPAMQSGDRVFVNLWSYGYRVPLSTAYGYHRWFERIAQHEEWVVYNSPLVSSEKALPDTSSLCIGRCLAMPGDTVWLGGRGHVSAYRNYSSGQIWPLVVPAKGTYVRITPWNAQLYARTIQFHEGVTAEVQGDSLCVDGRKVAYYRFHHNYYWMQSGDRDNLNDSRTLGFVPHEFLLGKCSFVFYSIDNSLPWHRRWLWKRMFTRL